MQIKRSSERVAKGLQGKRVVITGSRKLKELSEIIERQGGEAVVRPQQGLLVLKEQEVEQDLLQWIEEGTDWSLFTTGTGLSALLEQAERIGIRDWLVEMIRQSKVGARGYKTYALLKQLRIEPVATDEDGTTDGLISALQQEDFSGQQVTIQLHGELMPSLVAFLEGKGASVRSILPYKHVPPELEVSRQLCQEIIDGAVDAACFTTAVQVRYFFDYARATNQYPQLIKSFSEQVLAVAVGRVTADALQEAGVARVLSPDNERMGAMIIELARYYERTAGEREAE